NLIQRDCYTFCFLVYSYSHHGDLHSCPTRRSSDLVDRRQKDLDDEGDHAADTVARVLLHLVAGLVSPVPTVEMERDDEGAHGRRDRKSTRLNSSHVAISYAVYCLKKKKKQQNEINV